MLGAREKIKLVAKVAVTAGSYEIEPDLYKGESQGYRDRFFKQFSDRATSEIASV